MPIYSHPRDLHCVGSGLMAGTHALLTVRGRFEDGVVTLLDDVPLEQACSVLITFLEDAEMVLVPEPEFEVAARESAYLEVALTPRERDVLDLLHSGCTNREIAIALKLSTGTIRNYTSSLYDKLKVRNRLEAVTRAAEMGLLG